MTEPVELQLISPSRATDAGYLAAADLALVAGSMGAVYRLVGGNAVTLLVHAFGATELAPPRDTADADFGAAAEVIADERLVASLEQLGYQPLRSNHFTRVRDVERGEPLELAVDILAPSHDHRMRSNREHGRLHVDEIPGLTLALIRDPVVLDIEVSLVSGGTLRTRLVLPDVIAMLGMKAYAYRDRAKTTDAYDVWRLLEAATLLGLRPGDWPDTATGKDASLRLRHDFGHPGAPGLRRLQPVRTRVPALLNRLLGSP